MSYNDEAFNEFVEDGAPLRETEPWRETLAKMLLHLLRKIQRLEKLNELAP